MKIQYSLLACCATIGATLTSSAVQAEAHFGGGVSCRTYEVTNSADTFLNPVGGGATAIRNTSTLDKTVVCPFLSRDPAKVVTQAWISITSPNATCRVYQRSNLGTAGTSFPMPVNFTSNGRTNYAALGLSGNTSLNMSIWCVLPAGAWIEAYQWVH